MSILHLIDQRDNREINLNLVRTDKIHGEGSRTDEKRRILL